MVESVKPKFKFPLSFNIRDFAHGDKPVCVVAVVGKSRYNPNQTKATRLNSVIGADIFIGKLEDEAATPDASNSVEIWAYYSSSTRTIYLELITYYDTRSFFRVSQKAADQLSQMGGALTYMQQAEQQHTRALLFLFGLAHIIIIVNPGSTFDITWLTYFQILEIARNKLQAPLTDILKGVGVGKVWAGAARLCSPRVLFVFDSCPSEILRAQKTSTQKISPIKKLEHSIEDQIYRVLRKARIITNISNNSLFAIPANQEFVYMCRSKHQENRDTVKFLLGLLEQYCDNDDDLVSEFKPVKDNSENSFKEFLNSHIHLALSKGFDDNVGRNPVVAIFERPSVVQWLEAASAVHSFLLGPAEPPPRVRSHFITINSMLEVDLRFSEKRCAKVLPLAEGAYQEGLPPHYTKAVHIGNLVRAKKLFVHNARGAACERYLHQLEESCEKIWRNGRQLCETLSMTGAHCVMQLHSVPGEPVISETLPIMPHCSNKKTKSACNCGRKQTERDDPFTHKAANFDFYAKISGICCDALEAIEFPVFKASVSNAKAAETKAMQEVKAVDDDDARKLEVSPSPIPLRRDASRYDVVNAMSSLSLALDLGQSGADPKIYVAPVSLSDDDSSQSQIMMVASSQSSAASQDPMKVPGMSSPPHTRRQASTTEYLPCMLHSDCPPGLLPTFPSWALICVGKYSCYSAMQGMDQPGFSLGYNFLLPWDLNVRSDKWPTIGETGNKRGRIRRITRDSHSEMSVRVYCGFEYECPRGHRFFCSAPDKVFKAPTSGIFKETAHKVLHSDMPLYCLCNCRNPKGHVAQLMRFHIAVPEGPIAVHLYPKVQPGPSPCPTFFPGNDAPVLLPPGSFWVLRFPFVYKSETCVYRPPSDPHLFNTCKVLKGFCTVGESR